MNQKTFKAPRSNENGFTLAETAIVLVIVMIILGGILIPLGTQVQNKRIVDTQKHLEEIKEALIGFAIVNKRLPRPAESAANGAERAANCVDVTCTGFIPWATLGLDRLDVWGRMIRYSVTPSFANSPAAITITMAGDKTVRTRDTAGALADLAVNVPVVLMSSGARNVGFSAAGALLADSSATNLDEESNTNGTGTYRSFVSRTITEVTTAAGGEFDDIVTWIPTPILINRMVAAGQLP